LRRPKGYGRLLSRPDHRRKMAGESPAHAPVRDFHGWSFDESIRVLRVLVAFELRSAAPALPNRRGCYFLSFIRTESCLGTPSLIR
jgi:hypothetical protein